MLSQSTFFISCLLSNPSICCQSRSSSPTGRKTFMVFETQYSGRVLVCERFLLYRKAFCQLTQFLEDDKNIETTTCNP